MIKFFAKFVYLITLASAAVLCVTGFYHPLLFSRGISGYLLMVHATAAPVFAGCVAVLAVVYAAGNCLTRKDESRITVRKVCFWLVLVLTLPLVLSILLSMFLIFGTQGQGVLMDLHRYSASAIVLVGIVHTCLLVRSRADKGK